MSAPAIPEDVAKSIRLVSLDVDGVLTDGSVTIQAGTAVPTVQSRTFSVLDGLGIHLLREAGLTVALVSGKKSAAVRARAHELRIDEVHLGVTFEKVERIAGILERNGWTWAQVAHVGDDLADVALLERVGLPAAVVNAVPEVRAASTWIGSVKGGQGAVREFARALLEARGEWDEQVRRYVEKGRAT